MSSKVTIRPRRLARRLRLTLEQTREKLRGVSPRRGQAIRPISPETLADRLRDPSPIVLIFVGTPAHFARGHIPRSIPVPLHTLDSHLVNTPKSTEIFLYCGCAEDTLGAAGHGAEALRQLGFTRLRYLDGHLHAWRRAGYSLHTNHPPPQDTPLNGNLP